MKMSQTRSAVSLALLAMLSGCATPAPYRDDPYVQNEVVGAVIGGTLGGLLGSRVGEGQGRTAATIGGTIVGAGVGAAIGRSTDATRRTFAPREYESYTYPYDPYRPYRYDPYRY